MAGDGLPLDFTDSVCCGCNTTTKLKDLPPQAQDGSKAENKSPKNEQ